MPKCPGQDSRKLTVSYHPCPECSKPVEFFSDEMRIRCPHCKTMVYKDQVPNCIQWCQAAKDCLGPDLYKRLMGEECEDAKTGS
jgi:DNA-directed RNA polymerase subunit RPC12/RpoP